MVVVEKLQGRSLTGSTELVSEKTSQKVVSTSSAILAHHPSYLAAIMTLWSSCLVVIWSIRPCIF